MKNSYGIILLFFIGSNGCTNNTRDKLPVSTESTESIREIDKIRLTDLQGQTIELKQYEGNTIFINFWATWCKPCLEEMPSIQEAQNNMKNEKIVFLMASDESAEQIAAFSHENKFKFDYVRIENSEEMNVQALPTTFIYNNKGKLVFSETGSRKWDDENNIDLILKIVKEE